MYRRSHSSSYTHHVLPTPCKTQPEDRTHLEPQRRALADGRELRGLEVSEPERGQVAVLVREVREAVDDDRELAEEERQGFADEDQVRVASRFGTSCSAALSRRSGTRAYSVT